MSGKWFIGVALLGGMVVPAVGWAHGGRTHKVMGTVWALV